MTTRKFVAFAAAATLAATLASGAAQARNPVDVQWQVTIGSPIGGHPVHGGVVVSAPVYLPPALVVAPRYQQQYQYQPQYQPQHQQHYQPRPGPAYREPTRWDVDGDGVPNRYDRVYNPRWDRDGDGIPNRRDHNDRRDWRQDHRR